MPGRRIVTGADADGRSTVVRESPPATAPPWRALDGVELEEFDAWQVWALDAAHPDLDGEDPTESRPQTRFEAPVGWGLVSFPPGFGADGGGWHRTPSIDFVTVVSGKIVLALDEEEVQLGSGDCVVQRGTRHAWRNPSDEPCVLSVVSMPAS
jgi:mannose-6-phosphate isomerase-like protein (cupin superfamily)